MCLSRLSGLIKLAFCCSALEMPRTTSKHKQKQQTLDQTYFNFWTSQVLSLMIISSGHSHSHNLSHIPLSTFQLHTRRVTSFHVKGPGITKSFNTFLTVASRDDKVPSQAGGRRIPTGTGFAHLVRQILPGIVPFASAKVQNIHSFQEAIPIQRLPQGCSMPWVQHAMEQYYLLLGVTLTWPFRHEKY